MENISPVSLGSGIVVFYGKKDSAAAAANSFLQRRKDQSDKVLVVHGDNSSQELSLTASKPKLCSWREGVLWAMQHDPDLLVIHDLRLAPDMLVLVAKSGVVAVTTSCFDNADDVLDYLRGVGGLREEDQVRVMCIPSE